MVLLYSCTLEKKMCILSKPLITLMIYRSREFSHTTRDFQGPPPRAAADTTERGRLRSLHKSPPPPRVGRLHFLRASVAASLTDPTSSLRSLAGSWGRVPDPDHLDHMERPFLPGGCHSLDRPHHTEITPPTPHTTTGPPTNRPTFRGGLTRFALGSTRPHDAMGASRVHQPKAATAATLTDAAQHTSDC